MTHEHIKALEELIAAVESGGDAIQHNIYFKAAHAFPPETAYGNCTFHAVTQAFYGSLDAAKALHGALLPGVMCQRSPNGQFCLFDSFAEEVSYANETDNPARAWLTAILKAYREKMEVKPNQNN